MDGKDRTLVKLKSIQSMMVVTGFYIIIGQI